VEDREGGSSGSVKPPPRLQTGIVVKFQTGYTAINAVNNMSSWGSVYIPHRLQQLIPSKIEKHFSTQLAHTLLTPQKDFSF